MRGQAMQKICQKLQQDGYELSQMNALEFFAREGDWQTIVYADKVKSLCAWEIDPSFESPLKQNLPHAKIAIGDSFLIAKEAMFKNKFDWIVYDNPQGLYGENEEYCEHFEALETVEYLLSKRGIVIFNINHNPFGFEKQTKWQKRRELFYGLNDTSSISIEFLLKFYETFFKQRNFNTRLSFAENRNDEYLAYLVFDLERV